MKQVKLLGKTAKGKKKSICRNPAEIGNGRVNETEKPDFPDDSGVQIKAYSNSS